MVNYNNTKKEKQRFHIMAGMKFGTNNNGIKKVGYKLIEFTYDVNPNYPEDKMLISQKEIKRVITG